MESSIGALRATGERPLGRMSEVGRGRSASTMELLGRVTEGHPLHVALVGAPLTALFFAKALELTGELGRRRLARRRRLANLALAAGLFTGVPAALTGIADWTKTRGEARRLGLVPIAATGAAAALYAAALVTQASGRRRLASALSSTGLGCVLLTSWIGRKLVYGYGIGVNEARALGAVSPRLP